MKVISIVVPHGRDFNTTVETGWLLKRLVTYRGSSTVFHNLRTGRRATTDTECFLSDVTWKYDQDAPRAERSTTPTCEPTANASDCPVCAARRKTNAERQRRYRARQK